MQTVFQKGRRFFCIRRWRENQFLKEYLPSARHTDKEVSKFEPNSKEYHEIARWNSLSWLPFQRASLNLRQCSKYWMKKVLNLAWTGKIYKVCKILQKMAEFWGRAVTPPFKLTRDTRIRLRQETPGCLKNYVVSFFHRIHTYPRWFVNDVMRQSKIDSGSC